MARALHRLTATRAKAAVPGKYADGGGLWLYKREDGGAQWVLRYTLHGRRHEMGLGRFPDVALSEARDAAEGWRGKVRQTVDPIKHRERQRAKLFATCTSWTPSPSMPSKAARPS